MDIDRIVREVIAQLGLGPGGESPHAAPLECDEAVEMGDTKSDGQLVIGSRVVTLSEVEGRLDAVRRLVVPPRAVVTPSVRDALQRKNVTLVHASRATGQAASDLRLVLVAVGRRADPTVLIEALGNEPVRIERHAMDCLIEATERLAAEVVQPDTLGLLLTGHPAAGLCLANRHRGVRAVTGSDASAVSAASADVGANVLVLDPAAGSLFQLKQIVAGFCRGGARPCPEVFREQLA